MSKGLWKDGLELRERTQEVLGVPLVRKHNKWYADTEETSTYLGNSIPMAMEKLNNKNVELLVYNLAMRIENNLPHESTLESLLHFVLTNYEIESGNVRHKKQV